MATKKIDIFNNHWNKREKKKWLFCLFTGCGLVYACRSAIPLSAVAIAKEFDLTKKQMGIILSSFFWGYSVSQIYGGHLADKLGGDRVMAISAMLWSSITLMTPIIVYFTDNVFGVLISLICTRACQGALQGVHFPSLTSLLAKSVADNERAFSYSFSAAGTHLGLLLLGYIGSLILQSYGWTMVFHLFGGMALMWSIVIKSISGKRESQAVLSANVKSIHETNLTGKPTVPWKTLFSTKAFWSILIGHLSCNNAFYIIFSWMPTYFNEVFPDHAHQGWLFNVVPWVISLPCTIFSGLFSDSLVSKYGYSVTSARKICEGLCQFGCCICISFLGQVHSFPVALVMMGMAIACTGFHCGGILINPIDIAPEYSGAVFGVMNTVGALPGFVGVYLAGHILEVTGSWAAVFNLTSSFCFIGGIVFTYFGTGNQII